MFASLSSFLPSALHISTSNELPRQTVTTDDTITDDEGDTEARSVLPQREAFVEATGRGKEKDAKTASEVCIYFDSLGIEQAERAAWLVSLN